MFSVPSFTSSSPVPIWSQGCLYGQTVCQVLHSLKNKFKKSSKLWHSNKSCCSRRSITRFNAPATIPTYFLPEKNNRTGIYVLLESLAAGNQDCMSAGWLPPLWCTGCIWRPRAPWLGSDVEKTGEGRGVGGEELQPEPGSCLCCSVGALPAGGNAVGFPGSVLRLLVLTPFPSVRSFIIYCFLLLSSLVAPGAPGSGWGTWGMQRTPLYCCSARAPRHGDRSLWHALLIKFFNSFPSWEKGQNPGNRRFSKSHPRSAVCFYRGSCWGWVRQGWEANVRACGNVCPARLNVVGEERGCKVFKGNFGSLFTSLSFILCCCAKRHNHWLSWRNKKLHEFKYFFSFLLRRWQKQTFCRRNWNHFNYNSIN